MTYVPDPLRYQQLEHNDPNGGVNCTAWGAAFRVDAHSRGTIKTNGTQVRLHSDEPRPDPSSPGLNLGQVDASVIDITNGRVDFDTRVQSRSLSRAELKALIIDGRFCGLSVRRGVLVDRGWASGFRGSHDITVFVREQYPDNLVMFDSLVRTLRPVSWDAAFDAAEALTGGRIYAQLTRDTTPDYHWVCQPPAGKTARVFFQFHLVNGKIARKTMHTTKGEDARCTAPRYFAGAGKQVGTYLVRIIGGRMDGWLVNARFAEEIQP